MKQPVEYYKNKFRNIKTAARKRHAITQKLKQTGGGSLTKEEKRIVTGPEYADLILKLGKSAVGCEARADSDAQPGSSSEPPTSRLRNALENETHSCKDFIALISDISS